MEEIDKQTKYKNLTIQYKEYQNKHLNISVIIYYMLYYRNR